MGSSESRSSLPQTVPSQGPTIPPPVPQPNRAHPPAQVWAIALAAGVAAGLAAWLLGEVAYGFYPPRLVEINHGMGVILTQPTAVTQNQADFQNATLVFALVAGVIGLAMGLAGGLAGRSLGRGVVIGLGGLVVGGLIGALASRVLVPLFYQQYVPNPNDLLSPILIHGGIWAAIGTVGGLMFALGMRRGRRWFQAIGGACLGAILAVVLFHLLSASVFPDSGSTEPIANSSLVRLLAMLPAAVLIAVGAARGAQDHASPPASPESGP